MHVHLLQVEIRRDEAAAAIVRIRVLRQRGTVERTRRRRGDAVAVNEGVKPVGGGTAGGAEKAIKAVIERPAFDATGKIDATNGFEAAGVNGFALRIAKREPDMPFADGGGGVALLLQQGRKGETTFGDQRRPARTGEDRAAVRHAKGHPPGHEAVARRRANRGRTVRIGEPHAFARELVDVGRRHLRVGVAAAHIAVAEVVSEDDEKVGPAPNGMTEHAQKQENGA